MSRYLIIHADDLGMCRSVNKGIMHAINFNAVTSASVMVVCSWFPDVVSKLKDYKYFDIGVHLTFTSEWDGYKWRPLVNNDSFTDKQGYMFSTEEEFAAKARVREVELEARAQIECMLQAGIKPTHVDSHMFTVYSRPDIRNMCEVVASDYGLQFKQVPTLLPGIYVPEKEWYSHYDNLLSLVEEGINQLIVHPGLYDEELEEITWGKRIGNAQSRERDITVITSPEFKESIDKYGITLISWKDVKGIPCV